MTIPADWHFLSATDVTANVSRVRFSEDEQLQRQIRDHRHEPTLALTRYGSDHDGFNPMIQIRTPDVPPGTDARALLRQVAATIERLDQFEYVSAPAPVEIGDAHGQEMTVRFVATGPDGTRYPTQSWVRILLRDGRAIILSLVGTPDGDDACREVFAQVRDSFALM